MISAAAAKHCAKYNQGSNVSKAKKNWIFQGQCKVKNGEGYMYSSDFMGKISSLFNK